tara:strand:- start:564 stop:875 length:312 start_codon:yes stop_codon:yes gene_type:complete
MFIFKIIDGDFVLISEVTDGGRKSTAFNIKEHSFLIRGNVRIINNSVTANSIEINSSRNVGKGIDYLNLSSNGDGWINRRGDSADIQRFEEIVTCGKVLIVTE